MGFRFRKQIGPKGFKLNIGKNGITSTSLKIAPGITLNSKRGLTVGIPGTGMSYNFGNKKTNKPSPSTTPNAKLLKREQALERKRTKIEYNKGWREFTGGYSNHAKIAIAVSFAICLTPFRSLGSYLMIASLAWLTVDASIKTGKYKEHLRNLS